MRETGFDPWVGKIPWRRKWQFTPGLLPGKSYGQRSLVGYSPWGCQELDKKVRLHFTSEKLKNKHAETNDTITEIKNTLLLLSRFSHVRLCVTHRRQPTRLPRPWDSQGKNTGMGCHFLFQCVRVKSQSEVAKLCLTLSDPMDCSPPGSSIHGIFQARVLEWVSIAFSKS